MTESFGSYSSQWLAFPDDLTTNTDYAGNYIMFTAMKVSGGVDTRTLKFSRAEGHPTSVCLPIPQGLSFGYQNNWDQNEVGGGVAAMASKGAGVLNTIKSVTSENTLSGMVKSAGEAAGAMAGNIGSGLMGAASDIGGTADKLNAAGAGVVNEMMGFAATKPGIDNLLSAAQFSLGIRALKQTMTSYSGPGFRSFQWSFSLKPLSMNESIQAKAITQFFKTRSMPAQSDMQFTRIYNLPDVFRIQFYSGFSESPWIDKIGHCACTDVSIAYGGDRFTTFAGEHAPLQIDLSLSFKEMELLNRQAVQNEGNTGVWPEATYTKSAKPMQAPNTPVPEQG